jgi:hypothetical protein
MKKIIISAALLFSGSFIQAQTNPAILSWLQNSSIMGRHYVSGNSTAIQDAVLANVQTVQYSSNWAYVSTNGIPAYVTGPFLDGNPSVAASQAAIFKFPLNPSQNTGTPTNTTGGNIGVFINGVALFDYRDGVSYKNSSGADAGGPLGGQGDGVWNRDAVVAEKGGFDCSKGHPAMGNYHHHQNPSAFNLDLTVISTICNLYNADGLYSINASEHSPLIGFAYDGFPIYGAMGYANADGTGGIVRIKSSYFLRNITTRTHNAAGADVTDGPAVSASFPLGKYREDYEFIAPTSEDFLDVHNGRFCVTPEYPNGTYAYFCTVDANYNSYYPYAVGPTFYGNKVASKVNSITETVQTYTPVVDASGLNENKLEMNLTIFPNPSNDFIAVQIESLNSETVEVLLYDALGKLVQNSVIYPGSTICYLDTKALFAGEYLVNVIQNNKTITKKVILTE